MRIIHQLGVESEINKMFDEEDEEKKDNNNNNNNNTKKDEVELPEISSGSHNPSIAVIHRHREKKEEDIALRKLASVDIEKKEDDSSSTTKRESIVLDREAVKSMGNITELEISPEGEEEEEERNEQATQ